MANTVELAHALITVLKISDTPEPLGVDLKNYSVTEASEVLQAIIDEAAASFADLKLIAIDPSLLTDEIAQIIDTDGVFEGRPMRSNRRLKRRMELFRRSPA